MALTAEEIRSHTGLAPELRAVLIEMLAEIQSGGYVLPAATTSSLGGCKNRQLPLPTRKARKRPP